MSGAVGAALASRFFELEWILKTQASRAVEITDQGRKQLKLLLDIEV
jgi:hypothetical protein